MLAPDTDKAQGNAFPCCSNSRNKFHSEKKTERCLKYRGLESALFGTLLSQFSGQPLQRHCFSNTHLYLLARHSFVISSADITRNRQDESWNIRTCLLVFSPMCCPLEHCDMFVLCILCLPSLPLQLDEMMWVPATLLTLLHLYCLNCFYLYLWLLYLQ